MQFETNGVKTSLAIGYRPQTSLSSLARCLGKNRFFLMTFIQGSYISAMEHIRKEWALSSFLHASVPSEYVDYWASKGHVWVPEHIFCDGFSSQCPHISQKSEICVNGSTGPPRQNWCFANMAQIPRPHAMLKENMIQPLWVSFDLVAFLSHHQLPKDMIQGSLDGKRSLSKIRTFETLLGRSDSAEGSLI